MNEGPKWVFLFLWYGTNIGLFVGYFLKYHTEQGYYYLNLITGDYGVPFARASAACLNFNCMLLLLPVCRNLLSFVRGTICSKICRRNVTRLLDKNITFHKACAYMVLLHTAIHYWAHTFNFEYFIQAHNQTGVDAKTKILYYKLSNVGRDNNTWVNPIASPDTNPMLELVKTVPGLTGVGITLPLLIIIGSATEVIRRSYFEVFWYTHHLFVVFYICLVTHGLGHMVRSQSNLDVHNPENCQYKPWGTAECPYPTFTHPGAKTWYWVIAPMFLYLCERIIRFVRSQQKVVISKLVKHPSKVIQLQMKKKGFKMDAGQYVFLHCPAVSRLEWHPFTLTSAPQDDYFSVHIRIVGDWTSKLSKACHCDQTEMQDPSKMPIMAVDGPFGTASEDIYRYQTGVLVAAGIGVTPFASILKDLWYKYCHPEMDMKLQKVYFYWICPDTNAFEWFSDVLKYMEKQMAEAGKSDFLNYNIYLTRGWGKNEAMNIAAHDEDVYDTITGLRQKTYYGRPNWDQEFGRIADTHKGTRVGVFFCGPKVLSNTLHKMSNEHSDSKSSTYFVYNKENF